MESVGGSNAHGTSVPVHGTGRDRSRGWDVAIRRLMAACPQQAGCYARSARGRGRRDAKLIRGDGVARVSAGKPGEPNLIVAPGEHRRWDGHRQLAGLLAG